MKKTMRVNSVNELKVGIKVYWHDPAINDYPNPKKALQRVFTVEEIRNEEMVIIRDRHTVAEVLPEELEILNEQYG